MENEYKELLEVAKLGLEFAREQLSREKFEFADYPKFYELTEKYVKIMEGVIEKYDN